MRTPVLLFAAAAAFATPAQAVDIRPFTASSFQAEQAHNKSVVVFVHAPWCPICRAQEQTIQSLLKTPKYKNVQVLRIDFDSEKAVWSKFGVTRQSTLIGYHGRRETGRLEYQTDPAKVEAVLASTLR
jgi:thiol-disulfide isomerase/thioredoxin